MLTKIKKIFIKYQFMVLIGFKWWAWWSNFYQKLELKFMKTDFVNLEKYEPSDKISVSDRWTQYCKNNNLYHFQSDKWYMLWDVVSHPARFLARKGGDCDDYARLSYDFFGEHIYTNNAKYAFKGMVSILWNNGSGHSVAVWENLDKENDFIMVSNHELYRVDDYLESWDNRHDGIKWVGYFNIDENQNIIFEEMGEFE